MSLKLQPILASLRNTAACPTVVSSIVVNTGPLPSPVPPSSTPLSQSLPPTPIPLSPSSSPPLSPTPRKIPSGILKLRAACLPKLCQDQGWKMVYDFSGSDKRLIVPGYKTFNTGKKTHHPPKRLLGEMLVNDFFNSGIEPNSGITIRKEKSAYDLTTDIIPIPNVNELLDMNLRTRCFKKLCEDQGWKVEFNWRSGGGSQMIVHNYKTFTISCPLENILARLIFKDILVTEYLNTKISSKANLPTGKEKNEAIGTTITTSAKAPDIQLSAKFSETLAPGNQSNPDITIGREKSQDVQRTDTILAKAADAQNPTDSAKYGAPSAVKNESNASTTTGKEKTQEVQIAGAIPIPSAEDVLRMKLRTECFGKLCEDQGWIIQYDFSGSDKRLVVPGYKTFSIGSKQIPGINLPKLVLRDMLVTDFLTSSEITSKPGLPAEKEKSKAVQTTNEIPVKTAPAKSSKNSDVTKPSTIERPNCNETATPEKNTPTSNPDISNGKPKSKDVQATNTIPAKAPNARISDSARSSKKSVVEKLSTLVKEKDKEIATAETNAPKVNIAKKVLSKAFAEPAHEYFGPVGKLESVMRQRNHVRDLARSSSMKSAIALVKHVKLLRKCVAKGLTVVQAPPSPLTANLQPPVFIYASTCAETENAISVFVDELLYSKSSDRELDDDRNGAVAIGFDVEFCIDTPTVVQVSTGDLALVISLPDHRKPGHQQEIPQSLTQLLSSPFILKVGVGIENDGEKLKETRGIQLNNCIDLRNLQPAFATLGLRAISEVYGGGWTKLHSPGTKLEKWMGRLSPACIRYAATDAFIAYNIFTNMEADSPNDPHFIPAHLEDPTAHGKKRKSKVTGKLHK